VPAQRLAHQRDQRSWLSRLGDDARGPGIKRALNPTEVAERGQHDHGRGPILGAQLADQSDCALRLVDVKQDEVRTAGQDRPSRGAVCVRATDDPELCAPAKAKRDRLDG
jgi:hypothetical protein